MTVNEELFNRGVRHAMLLEGLKDAVARIGRFMAGPMQKDMVDQIVTAVANPQRSGEALDTKTHLEELGRDSKDSMSAIMKDTVSTLNDLGTMSATFARRVVDQRDPVQIRRPCPDPTC